MMNSDEYGKMPNAMETQKLQMHLLTHATPAVSQFDQQSHVQVPAQQVQVHEISPVSGESESSHEEMWNQYNNGGAMQNQ